MSAGWPWDVLDMRPSGDVRAIRRAYAAALKSGDYDSDTDGFMALRQARDVALEMAEAGEIDAFDVGLGDDEIPAVVVHDGQITDSDIDAVAPVPLALQDAADPEVRWQELPPPTLGLWAQPDLQGRPLEDLYQALFDVLVVPFDPARQKLDQASAPVRLEAILKDPRLAELAVHDAADKTIAEILARTVPASDPLIPRAAEYFRWAERAKQIDIDPAILFVMERQETLRFLDEVQKRSHRLNGAWRFMTRPPRTAGWPAGSKRINELMTTIRQRHPALEAQLDSERIGKWEAGQTPNSASGGGWPGWIAIVIAITFLRLCAQPTHQPFVPPALTNPAADIDKALTEMLGGALSGEKLAAEHPALYLELVNRWKTAKASETSLAGFDVSIRDELRERVERAAPRLGDATLSEQWKIRHDASRIAAQANNPCAINAPVTQLLFKELPPELKRRLQSNLAATLIEAKDPLPPLRDRYTYTIPGAVFDDAARRAKISPEELGKAFKETKESEIKCRGRIALVEAALAAPRAVRLKLLRAM